MLQNLVRGLDGLDGWSDVSNTLPMNGTAVRRTIQPDSGPIMVTTIMSLDHHVDRFMLQSAIKLQVPYTARNISLLHALNICLNIGIPNFVNPAPDGNLTMIGIRQLPDGMEITDPNALQEFLVEETREQEVLLMKMLPIIQKFMDEETFTAEAAVNMFLSDDS